MEDAHTFYNEANKDGLDFTDDEDDNQVFVSRRRPSSDSQNLWQASFRRKKKRKLSDEVRKEEFKNEKAKEDIKFVIMLGEK